MRLLLHLILGLVGVVLLCLACTTGWVLFDAHRTIEGDTASSADRVAGKLQNLEDDGGGDPSRICAGSGHGILGIRERIAALGGSLSIVGAARGVRVAAIIPLIVPPHHSSTAAIAA